MNDKKPPGPQMKPEHVKLPETKKLPLFIPPVMDFRMSKEMAEAVGYQLPEEEQIRCRQRIWQEFPFGRRSPLVELMKDLMRHTDFISAYFHPKQRRAGAEAKDPWNDGSPRVAAQQWDDRQTEINDGPYRLALGLARKADRLKGLLPEDKELARMAAFLTPLGQLRMWDVVKRGGGDPRAFIQSGYGHALSRYVRSGMVHAALAKQHKRDQTSAYVLSRLLDERHDWAPERPEDEHQAMRVGSAMVWTQILLKQALTRHKGVRT